MVDEPQPRCAPGLVEGHGDGRLLAASAIRNTEPITDALRGWLDGQTGTVLEIGSGTGQHAAAWAAAFPEMDWQPSDPFQSHLDSISAWVHHAGRENLREPVVLDAAKPWPDLGVLSAVISVNVIHISPWTVCEGMIGGAARALKPGGRLFFYGPFREGGAHTGEGNAAFDARLRQDDPSWGIRDIGDVTAHADSNGFVLDRFQHMPANNRFVCYRRT